jgi:hypothetical protein
MSAGRSEEYSDEETARRRDELARHMLNMPPQPLRPHSEMKLGKNKKQATNPKTRPARKGRLHKGKTKD